jgi:hypothetical protein
VATAHEIAACCQAAEYLRAALMAAGRSLAGEPDGGFRLDALVVSYHVWQRTDLVPWPDWLDDVGAVEEVRAASAESARLVASAALAAGVLPTTRPAFDALLDAFNAPFPKVRNWLGFVVEAQTMPGVWEWVGRDPTADPLAKYVVKAKAFRDLRDQSIQTQNAGRAYTSRQNYWLSRSTAVDELYRLLGAARPDPRLKAPSRAVAEFLGKTGRRLTTDWCAEFPKVDLKVGGLEHRQVAAADHYLAVATDAWQAGRAVLLADSPPPELERVHGQLLHGRQAALDQAAGHSWEPLVRRISEAVR